MNRTYSHKDHLHPFAPLMLVKDFIDMRDEFMTLGVMLNGIDVKVLKKNYIENTSGINNYYQWLEEQLK